MEEVSYKKYIQEDIEITDCENLNCEELGLHHINIGGAIYTLCESCFHIISNKRKHGIDLDNTIQIKLTKW